MSIAMETCTKNGGIGSPVGCIMDCDTDSCDSLKMDTSNSTSLSNSNGIVAKELMQSHTVSCSANETTYPVTTLVDVGEPQSSETHVNGTVADVINASETTDSVESRGIYVTLTVDSSDNQQDENTAILCDASDSSISDDDDSSYSGNDSDSDENIEDDVSSKSPIIIDDQSCSESSSVSGYGPSNTALKFSSVSATISSVVNTVPVSTTFTNGNSAVASSLLASRSDQQAPLLLAKHSDRESMPAGVRPMAKLLQDTGLLLASEKVFKYLVQIQRQKVDHAKKVVNVADVQLLDKLKTSYTNIVSRNTDFALRPSARCFCGFLSESRNVLQWHQQCGEWGPGKCCMCNGEYNYRTRSQFEKHLLSVHQQTSQNVGRPVQYSCGTCHVDENSRALMKQHESRCRRQFVLSNNLSPQISHEDIPMKYATLAKNGPLNDVTILVNLPPATTLASTVRTTANTFLSSSSTLVKTVSTPAVLCKTSQSLLKSSVKSSTPSITDALSTTQLLNIGGKLYSIQTEDVSTSNTRLQLSPAPVTGTSNRSNVSVSKYQLCPLCQGFVKDDAALEIHMRVVHGSISANLAYCWMCQEKVPVHVKDLLSHIADKHDVTMATMLLTKRCSLCATLPTVRNASAFELHMLQAHQELFVNAEKLWQSIDMTLTKPCQHVMVSDDGTLQCQRCSSNFISRAFLCRHSFLSHAGLQCNCIKCPTYSGRPQPSSQSSSDTSAVVTISDDEDEIVSKRRRTLSGQEESAQLTVEERRTVNALLDRDGFLIDKVEEVLEIDGETILIVQGADEDDDNKDDNGRS